MNINQSLNCCNLVRRLLTVACLTSLLSTAVLAQNEGLDIAKVEGTLEDMGGYQLKVKPEKGESTLVGINPQKTDFVYVGTAEREFLLPGLMVRFTAAFDVNGKPQAALKELEIFVPARKRRMTNEYMRDQTPGIHSIDPGGEPGKANAKTGEKKTDKAAGKEGKGKSNVAAAGATATAGSSVMDFRIVGKLTGIQGNVIQVAAGNRPIMVELAEELKITVAAGDTTFCVAGDKVSATGLKNAAQPNYVEAEKITITAAKPLALPKPGESPLNAKGKSQSARARRGKQDQDPAKGTDGTKPSGTKPSGKDKP